MEEQILTYVQRYFETDEDGFWRCPWLPLLAHLYVPARYAQSPPGAVRRRRNWARRKQLVLLKALEARRRATTTTALARFLCRLCPEPQFRDIIGRL